MTQSFDADATEPVGPPSDNADSTGDATQGVVSSARSQVNLLPYDVRVVRRRRRLAYGSVALSLVWVAVLIALGLAQFADVDAARDERDARQAEVAGLEDQVAELAEFGELADTLRSREALLIAAMTGELSWSGVLGDLALSFDPDASLTEVQAVALDTDAEALAAADAAPIEEPGGLDLGDPVGQLTFTGYSVDRFAPGVEDVLENFNAADGFFGSYLATALDEERGDQPVTTFEGRVGIDESARTGRFDDGLPTEDPR